MQLVGKMRPRRELPGREVCHQGDAANRLWILTEGQVLVLLNGDEGQVEGDPAVLGETALLQDDAPHFKVYPLGFRSVLPSPPACVSLGGCWLAQTHRMRAGTSSQRQSFRRSICTWSCATGLI